MVIKEAQSSVSDTIMSSALLSKSELSCEGSSYWLGCG